MVIVLGERQPPRAPDILVGGEGTGVGKVLVYNRAERPPHAAQYLVNLRCEMPPRTKNDTKKQLIFLTLQRSTFQRSTFKTFNVQH